VNASVLDGLDALGEIYQLARSGLCIEVVGRSSISWFGSKTQFRSDSRLLLTEPRQDRFSVLSLRPTMMDPRMPQVVQANLGSSCEILMSSGHRSI